MMTTGHTPASLLSAGYVCTHFAATWVDVGDAENGPELCGGPAYDLYQKDTDIYTVVDGKIVDHFIEPPHDEEPAF